MFLSLDHHQAIFTKLAIR